RGGVALGHRTDAGRGLPGVPAPGARGRRARRHRRLRPRLRPRTLGFGAPHLRMGRLRGPSRALARLLPPPGADRARGHARRERPARVARGAHGSGPIAAGARVTVLLADALARRVRDVDIVAGASLAIARAEFVALLGRSGCGKTTLLQ